MPETPGFPLDLMEQIRQDSLKRARNNLAEHFRIYGARLDLRYLGTEWSDECGLHKVIYEWHVVGQSCDEIARVEMRGSYAKRRGVSLPATWRARIGGAGRPCKCKRRRSEELAERLTKYAAAMSVPERVERAVAKHYSFQPPLVGKFTCTFVGPSAGVEDLEPWNRADMQWYFEFRRRSNEYPYDIRVFDVQSRVAKMFCISVPLTLPHKIGNAFSVALLMERLPLPCNRSATYFLRNVPASTSVVILAVGFPKALLEMPEVTTLVEDHGKKHTKLTKDYLVLAQVRGDMFMTHPGYEPMVWRKHARRQDRIVAPYFNRKFTLVPKDVVALSVANASNSADSRTRKIALAALARSEEEDHPNRFPAHLDDINRHNGQHRGLRDTFALSHALSEISNAQSDNNRKIDMTKAMASAHLDPNDWDENARSRKWLFLWQSQNATGVSYHADLACIEKTIPLCKPA